MLDKMTTLVEKLVVNKEKMLKNIGATRGLIYSQHLMLGLIRKGATRMEAYDIIQTISLDVYDKHGNFKDFSFKNKDVNKYMTEQEIEECFDLKYHLRHIDTVFKNIGL